MKTAPVNNGRFKKEAFLFRTIAPAIQQEQDDRMRQILREELAAHSSAQQPSPKAKKKHASIGVPFSLALIGGFSDEFRKIKMAQMAVTNTIAKPTLSSQGASNTPKNTLDGKPPTYSQVNPASTPGPAQMHQPTLSPPPVRG